MTNTKNINQKRLNNYTFNMIAFLDGAKVIDKEKHIIHLDGKYYHAEVHFYLGKVAEFTVKDRKSDEVLYYLHFEMTDFETINHHLDSLVHFLQSYRPGTRYSMEKNEKHQMKKPLKILISCTSGMTSSYFAWMMQETASGISDRIRVEAADYMRLDGIYEEYDYILLAPQIAHKLEEYKKKFGENRVLAINVTDFASRNVDRVLENILKMHNEIPEKNFFRRLRKRTKECMM